MIRKLNYYKKLYFDRHWLKLIKILDRSGWNLTRSLIIVSVVIAIFAVVFNIYLAVTNASQDYKVLEIQRAKLEELNERQAELDSELDYFSSLEYKQRYAYDSLNLVRPGEDIYLIEKSDRAEFELEKENSDPIKKNDVKLWWDFIISLIL